MRGKKTLMVAVSLAAIFAVSEATAGKIGFVEVERAVASVEEGKQKLKELNDWAKPYRKRIEELKRKHAEIRARLVRQRAVASEEALKRLEEEELKARRDVEDAVREFQREYDKKQTEVLKDVATKLNKVISEYAEANGFDAVLIFKPRTIIYLSPQSDLTDTIIKLYNQKYPAPAASSGK